MTTGLRRADKEQQSTGCRRCLPFGSPGSQINPHAQHGYLQRSERTCAQLNTGMAAAMASSISQDRHPMATVNAASFDASFMHCRATAVMLENEQVGSTPSASSSRSTEVCASKTGQCHVRSSQTGPDQEMECVRCTGYQSMLQ